MNSRKIAQNYFELVESYFGPLFKLGPEELDHIELGHEFSSYRLLSNLILNSIEDLGNDISNFWKENGSAIEVEMRDSPALKCIYSGDLSPLNALKLTKRTALYVDTILLPDPMYKLAVQLKGHGMDRGAYLNRIIRHAANMYKLRDLMLADCEFPIVAVAPLGMDHFEPKVRSEVLASGAKKFLEYCERLFDYKFDSPQAIHEQISKVDTTEKLFGSIVRKDLLPRELQSHAGIKEFVNEFQDAHREFEEKLGHSSPGGVFATYIMSQTLRVEEHKRLCADLASEPIYDVERAWFFMNQDLGGPNLDSGIIQGLQNSSFNWIGNVSPDALKVLREEKQMEDFRQILRRGLTDLRVKADGELEKTADQLQKNLQECLAQHNSEIAELQKKVNKISCQEIPITIIGALLGWIPGIGNFLSLPFSTRDLINQAKAVEEGTIELSRKRRSPVNFLMQVKE